MQLVEVDPVGLQALEAGVEGGDDVLAVVSELAVADVLDAVARAGDLAGDDPLGAVAAAPEIVADDLFGLAVGLGARRHRVHLGGVDEIDPGRAGPVDLRERFVLAVLLAPGHGAQAKSADLEVGAAQLTEIHMQLLRQKGHESRLKFLPQSA
ncbi:hypothetical protein D9M69_409160 [compost metagenome]